MNDGYSNPGPSPHKKASVWLWTLGGLGAITGTCMVMGLAQIAAWPVEQIVKELAPRFNEEQATLVKAMAMPTAIGLVLFWLLPAIAYLMLGFGVRAGRGSAIRTARWITLVQLIVIGLLILLGLPGALRGAEGSSLFMLLVLAARV